MASGHGGFIISLDFELHWGVRDFLSVEDYRENLMGERAAVPALLKEFHSRGVRATWATVGMLFAENRKELLKALPVRQPQYSKPILSPYLALDQIGESEAADPFHYAATLVRLIAEAPGQELATHTFSHYYCLEEGQTAEDFDADLEAAQEIGRNFGPVCKSLVFPRNQYNPAYREVMRRRGVRCFRSNGEHWAYRARPARENPLRRIVRLADSYAPIAGKRTARLRGADEFGLVDEPASLFLRPWSPSVQSLDVLRLRRITSEMTKAARDGEIFHLWWHPHNFGKDLRENMVFLRRVLDHLDTLRRRYGMASWSMADAATAVM